MRPRALSQFRRVPFGPEIRQRIRFHQQPYSALPAHPSSQHFCLQVSSWIHRLVINFSFDFKNMSSIVVAIFWRSTNGTLKKKQQDNRNKKGENLYKTRQKGHDRLDSRDPFNCSPAV